MRSAISTLRSAVLAMPTSSMVRTITALLNCFAREKIWPAFSGPDSRWVELIKLRPGLAFRAASITSISVESITSGTGTALASFLTSARIRSASSARSVRATHRSSPCAPLSTCWRAIPTMVSRSSAITNRLNFRDPWVFNRSPIRKGAGCWIMETACTGEAISATRSGWGGLGRSRFKRWSSSWMWSSRVPQHPPITRTPYSFTNSINRSAKGSGSIG